MLLKYIVKATPYPYPVPGPPQTLSLTISLSIISELCYRTFLCIPKALKHVIEKKDGRNLQPDIGQGKKLKARNFGGGQEIFDGSS